jgi:hypothetical protein
MPPSVTHHPVRVSVPTDGWGQHKKRGQMILFDQHKSKEHPEGRPWWTSTEIQVDPSVPPQPVGELMPVSADIDDGEGDIIKGWTAPWYPEQKYMLASASQRIGNRFKIKYAAMQADYREATEAYYKRAAVEAAAHNLPIPNYGAPIPWKLRQIVGEAPKSPKIPEAAMAGDKWLLGETKEANDLLRRYLYTGQASIASPEEMMEQEAKDATDELLKNTPDLAALVAAEVKRQRAAEKAELPPKNAGKAA